MRYVRYEQILRDTSDIPEGEIFTVYSQDKLWAFAMKVGKEFTLSKFKKQDVSKEEVTLSYKQVLFAKKNGWSNTNEQRFDDIGERCTLMKCLYCGKEIFSTEVEAPCPCRSPLKKTALADFILPL